MIIGVDLDEVLVPTTSLHCRFLNRKYGFHLKQRDVVHYDFWDIYGGTREEAIRDFMEFSITRAFRHMKPYVGAVKGVKQLREIGVLHVITSRPDYLKQDTERLIREYFNGYFAGIDNGNHFSFEGESVTKRELCRRNNIDLLVDDNERYALEVSQDIPVILLAKPWNSPQTGNITRVGNWRGIVSQARKLAK